jgi:hypothetical protein
MYFQHNILEAGAHWVDCPWRPANNLNATDFPEPPPFRDSDGREPPTYEAGKRIFMAEQFYDVTHPCAAPSIAAISGSVWRTFRPSRM